MTLFFIVTNISFSQKIIIHIFEKQEMGCFRKTTLDSVLINSDFLSNIDSSYTKYVLDLTKNISTYTINGKNISNLPIEYEFYGDSILKINIIEGDLDYGLLINTTKETVLWYWFSENMTTVKKINKCYFENPS
jgi:hypothetical protein